MRKIPIVLWPIGGILILLGIVVFCLLKVPPVTEVSTETANLKPGESLKIRDIKYSQDYEDGEGRWELKAKEGHFFGTSQVMALKDVLLKVDSQDETSFTIRGEEGDYCRQSGEIVLRGDVRGTSANGYQIETSLLIYKQKQGSVETDKPIRVIGPFFQVDGDGLYVDLREKTFKVRRNALTTVTNGDFL